MPRLLPFLILTSLTIGCSRSKSVPVGAIPFTMQLQMKEGDAYEFRLPDGKTVAVWCARPEFPMVGEQTTQSGLKTRWGEKAFQEPELVMRQTAPNSYVAAGWKSYIVQGSVTTSGDRTSEYELFIGDLRFSILENLRATSSLPVTIQITRK